MLRIYIPWQNAILSTYFSHVFLFAQPHSYNLDRATDIWSLGINDSIADNTTQGLRMIAIFYNVMRFLASKSTAVAYGKAG